MAAQPQTTQTWKKGPAWLNNTVIYQVYPSSFKDSDGNGIGDIPGEISKLDYIEKLGVGVVWFNPLFVSGWIDGGYDVIDYYKVDPRFGTNTDLVNLVNECHKRGIKVMLDLVPGHTSMDHPWFKQSMEADANQQYSDYYIWTNLPIPGLYRKSRHRYSRHHSQVRESWPPCKALVESNPNGTLFVLEDLKGVRTTGQSQAH